MLSRLRASCTSGPARNATSCRVPEDSPSKSALLPNPSLSAWKAPPSWSNGAGNTLVSIASSCWDAANAPWNAWLISASSPPEIAAAAPSKALNSVSSPARICAATSCCGPSGRPAMAWLNPEIS